MYFKRIEMHGFKSFAEPVSIEFHEGITCIVGPNGSGKSNISDAIRWVLGEQSPKMLRGGKMEEVIFAGTANRKSRGMAEVTLVVDNTTGILPIDYNEVAITRRMYRSGDSEYSINNNQCRLRDIRELIMDTGIGVDGYSLIGQGKISDIVSNKTESRREIFEEAAGIVMYRNKKAESERKLAATNANLERVNDIVSEIEGRIGTLKEDSKKAQEFLKLRERYKELEVNITLKNIENIELKNEYLKDDIAETTSSIDNFKDEKVKIDRDVQESREKNIKLEALVNETRDKLLASVEEINKLVNTSQLNTEKLTSIEKNKDRINSELIELSQKLEKENANARELFESKKVIDDKLLELDNTLKQKVEKYAEISGVLAKESKDIDDGKNNIFKLHSIITTKEAESGSLRSLQGTLEKRRQQIITEMDSSNKGNRSAIMIKELATEERDVATRELEELRKGKEQANQLYNNSLSEERLLASKLEEMRICIGQISSRKKTIEEMESNYEGYNSAVKFIMKRQIRGIFGVVADLIEVPLGYELAIETALGAGMQNIVCDKDSSAKDAISALKNNKAGRLTFLPLESIRATGVNADNGIIGEKGFIGYGVDCISFDDKYKKIMNYLLSRVVIVDNMDNAVRLSKIAGGNLRFVTLEGEVINSGGAITGGKYRNNTASLLERKAEIAKLTTKLAELNDEKSKGMERIAELRKIMEESFDEISVLDQKIREKEMFLLTKEKDLSVLENTLKDFELGKEKWQKELNNIDEEMTSSNLMIEKLLEEIKLAKGDIEKVETKIEQALAEYENRKGSIENANEDITKARIEVTACQSEKNNVDAIVERINNSVDDINLQMELKQNELEKLISERNIITDGHSDVQEIVEEKEESKKILEAYLEEIVEEKATLSVHLNEISAAKEKIDEQVVELQNQKYEMDIKLAKHEAQLDNYKDKLWEEFEVSYVQAIDFKKKDFSMNSAVKESREIKERIKELGDVNIGSIKEYENVGERYEFLTTQRADILEAMEGLKKIIDDMDKTIRIKFKESFDAVVVNFEQIFQELFGGGHAELRLDDELRPLDSGIEIIAQPPGKKLQNINLMSGGEKTMTAIALMFAVLKTKPTPFCILDEVEAALDDANIDRFANYLKNFKEIQFALVTHQKATMEHANVLYGVTMPEQGVSKIISLKLGDDFILE